MYWREYSLTLGSKTPICKNLNEQADQQGGEGTKTYRLIFSLSTLF